MYKIIGADQKEYGPITAEQLRQWIVDGRLTPDTRVKPSGANEWQLLINLPEFSEALSHRAQTAPVTSFQPAPAPKTSGMAVTSLVLGLLGFCGITAFAGLILGIISMVRIKKSEGRLSGSGIALAGTIVSALFLVIIPVAMALMLPAMAKAKGRVQSMACSFNVTQLTIAAQTYADEHNSLLPSAETWCDLVQTNVISPSAFKCPTQQAAGGESEQCHYAFNSKLSGKDYTKANPKTVLIFESSGGWNANGGPELLIDHPRHEKIVVGLVSGEVEQVLVSELDTLQWDP